MIVRQDDTMVCACCYETECDESPTGEPPPHRCAFLTIRSGVCESCGAVEDELPFLEDLWACAETNS